MTHSERRRKRDMKNEDKMETMRKEWLRENESVR